MKKYLFLALALVIFVSCKKTRVEVQDNVDSYIADHYEADVEELLARLYFNGSLAAGADEVPLNSNQLEIIKERLSAVYRLHIPATDSLFKTLNMHVYPSTDLKSIELEIDSTSAAGKNVVDYKPSGNADFDALLKKYGFSYVPTAPTVSNYGFINISSKHSWNIAALLKNLKTYDFVIEADDNELFGDGSDIVYELDGTNALITFEQKSEDCIDGCELIKSWRFKVDANNKATFLGN